MQLTNLKGKVCSVLNPPIAYKPNVLMEYVFLEGYFVCVLGVFQWVVVFFPFFPFFFFFYYHMVKGCYPGHQAIPISARTAAKSEWMYIKLETWTETCSHQHKTSNSICRMRKQAKFLTSHPVKSSFLVKTTLIEELIINQPKSVLY